MSSGGPESKAGQYLRCTVNSGHSFVFQAPPEAFHRGIVITVPFARHGSQHAELLDQFSIIMGAVLAAPIGVMDQSRCGTLVTHGTPQRLLSCRQRFSVAFQLQVSRPPSAFCWPSLWPQASKAYSVAFWFARI